MKNNKKIILAAGAAALGLVAATGVTSGFAWFVANSTVEISNLKVTAKANDPYLVTDLDTEGNKTASALQTSNKKAYEFSPLQDLKLDASALNAVAGEPASPIAEKTYSTVLNTDYVGTAANWYTKNSTVAGTSNESTINEKALDADSFAQYVKNYQFAFTILPNTPKLSGLKITKVSLPKQSEKSTGISVVLTSTTGGAIFNSSYEDSTGITLYSGEITDTTVVRVNAYIYLNGNDDQVFTNNIDNLTGNLSFTIGSVVAA